MSWLSDQIRSARWRFRQRHLNNFVFVHIPKTAGTSVNHALHLPHDHKTALQIRTRLGQARWDKKFKFAFVRNPWDRMVSYYHFKTQQKDFRFVALSFSEYLRKVFIERNPLYYSDIPQTHLPQFDWITDTQDKLIVDFVGRFETINDDFAKICEKIGQPSLKLPHANAAKRGDYRTYYKDNDADIVGHWFRRDVDFFGYTF